ncbi:CopY/TcrY family copper transport repressor [Vagococcus coleopterorum]|uniref:CopY/TcrY family copper transport repressor n=1 Tax=Vagococcus coleopterorum TaxID=2714946 RepID=A0A6G8ANG2_9ENTE|nr:CopY/TcrY family copper transport repressor [Vagococcus coleopterorum]QIL46510.1 CopY/TcrY family copper transport repressor [Vagococcus coleopterorum]
MSLNKISEAEWQVMRVVWAKGETTSPEIIASLSETMNWKPATIKTLIGRLVKKDMLGTKADGNKYIYRPLVTEEATLKSATADLFSRVCAKKMGNSIIDIINEAELTQEDVQKIQQALGNKKTVSEVTCNCIPGQCECQEHQTN